jgi:phospholipase C
METRREFIKKASLLSAAAGFHSMIPAAVQKALAIDPATGTTWLDAEHVVILMQENRSFDHCFGTLRGVRGFNDPRAIQLPNENLVWMQSNAAGETFLPFRLDIKNTKATWMESLPHSWMNQVNARNDGKYDQWLNEKRNHNAEYADMPLTLGYYTREDIPFYYALADAFTVCDQHFCSALAGTDPNRLYFWTGTIRAEQNEQSRANVWNEDTDYEKFHWNTFPERLEEHGVSWKVYQNEISYKTGLDEEHEAWLSNFGDNSLEFFAQYNISVHKNSEAFSRLSEKGKSLHNKAFATNRTDPFYRELTDLHYSDAGTERSLKIPKGDLLHQFREDVKGGKLPAVSWLVAPENLSDHPSAAWYGAWYISEVMNILTNNPEVWKKTIFILTYDENDGYFDHVPPFVAPHSHKEGTGKVSKGIDTRVEFVTLDQENERKNFPKAYDRESPIGLGYRVPMVIASPWSRGGYVNSEVFDHTSTLQFLETFLSKKTGKLIREPNIGNWRRMICGDLTSCFRPHDQEKLNEPDFIDRNHFVEQVYNAKFKKLPDDYTKLTAEEAKKINENPYSSAMMPQQEKGIKKSCALPYQLYADGKLNADKSQFEIEFNSANEAFGSATAGCPFNVYAPGKYLQSENGTQTFKNVRTWAYGVAAGDRVADAWPLSEFENNKYHLRVYGPNGFFREFRGSSNDSSITVHCEYQRVLTNYTNLTGNIELVILNYGPVLLPVELTDNVYGSAVSKSSVMAANENPGRLVIPVNLSGQYEWYDFSLKIAGDTDFERRFAGRVETGKESFSDPFMGRMI